MMASVRVVEGERCACGNVATVSEAVQHRMTCPQAVHAMTDWKRWGDWVVVEMRPRDQPQGRTTYFEFESRRERDDMYDAAMYAYWDVRTAQQNRQLRISDISA